MNVFNSGLSADENGEVIPNDESLVFGRASERESGARFMYEVSEAFHKQYAELYDKPVRVYFKDGSVRSGLFNDEFLRKALSLLVVK